MTEIQFTPERRRGDQPARFGRTGGATVMGPGGIKRQAMTPGEMAAWKLNQALTKHPNFTAEARQQAQNEFVDMPGLRTMNMRVFATTLSFIHDMGELIPDHFKNNVIMPYIEPLLPIDLSTEDRDRLIVRFKAQILIYNRAIKEHRDNF
jgi:hypothetical protein